MQSKAIAGGSVAARMAPGLRALLFTAVLVPLLLLAHSEVSVARVSSTRQLERALSDGVEHIVVQQHLSISAELLASAAGARTGLLVTATHSLTVRSLLARHFGSVTLQRANMKLFSHTRDSLTGRNRSLQYTVQRSRQLMPFAAAC